MVHKIDDIWIEHGILGVGSDRSTNYATTTARIS